MGSQFDSSLEPKNDLQSFGADKFRPDMNRAAEIESGVQRNHKLNSYDLPMKLVQLGNQQKGHFV